MRLKEAAAHSEREHSGASNRILLPIPIAPNTACASELFHAALIQINVQLDKQIGLDRSCIEIRARNIFFRTKKALRNHRYHLTTISHLDGHLPTARRIECSRTSLGPNIVSNVKFIKKN